MKKYLLKRLGRYVLILYLLATVIFVMFRLMPNDPTAMLVTGQFTEEARNELLRQFGLNRPLHEQYYLYLINLLQGNMGVSFHYQKPVLDILIPRFMNTLIIMAPGMILVFVGSYTLGKILGWRKGDTVEVISSYLLLSLRAVPHFVAGVVLLMIFSYWLGWFPNGGMAPIDSAEINAVGFLKTPSLYKFAALPIATIVLHYLADPYLLMRGDIVDQKDENYVHLYRLKGLGEGEIRDHAARNSLLPLVTYSATLVSIAFGGVILIEVVFSWPGIGRELVLAVRRADYPLAQAAFLIIGGIVMTANLVIDLLYGYLDPRITYEET